MPEIKRLPWRCVKCGTPKVVSSSDPMDQLQPTLDPSRRIGWCGKCTQKRLFSSESSA